MNVTPQKLVTEWRWRAADCAKTLKLYGSADKITTRQCETAAEVYRTCARELDAALNQNKAKLRQKLKKQCTPEMVEHYKKEAL